MNVKKQPEGFETVWERRKQNWQQQAARMAPDDSTILHMAELARKRASVADGYVSPFTIRRRGRWVPYAAAASLIVGVAAIGLNRQVNVDSITTPVAQEVDVDGNTMFFLCNNGCSAQDVVLAANNVIKK